MRKNAWVICCCTAVLAAFGTFFRWLQDQVCFEADTGLAVRGSIWPYAVALMIVIAAVVLAVVCFRMKNQPHTYFPDSLPAALAASPRVRTIGGIVLGALLAVGGLWLLLGSGTLASPGLQRVLAVLAIAAGAADSRDGVTKAQIAALLDMDDADYDRADSKLQQQAKDTAGRKAAADKKAKEEKAAQEAADKAARSEARRQITLILRNGGTVPNDLWEQSGYSAVTIAAMLRGRKG